MITRKVSMGKKAAKKAKAPQKPLKPKSGGVSQKQSDSAETRSSIQKKRKKCTDKDKTKSGDKTSRGSLTPVPVQLKQFGPKERSTIFLLAHGASGNSDSPQMVRYRDLLAQLGTVFQFDYPGSL